MKILGISAFYHDSAACLIDDGKIVAAAQEERFSRIKNDASFPEQAIRFCLEFHGITADQLDAVVFYEKPIIKFDRILESYLAVAPAGLRSFVRSFPTWIKHKLNVKQLLINQLCLLHPDKKLWQQLLRFSEHHLSHAASAFFPSPYAEAAVITLDGTGEWTTGCIWHGQGTSLTPLEEMRFPHSVGLLYSAFTQYLGFAVNDGEYKVMGLAAYGQPHYQQLIKSNLVTLHDDGSFHLNMDYFGFTKGVTMTNRRFHQLFGAPPRPADAPLTQMHFDIACSIQVVTEEILLGIARRARQLTGSRSLCLAGGVALNCRANGVLHRSGVFDQLWVQPAAGDAGGAMGAALAFHYLHASGNARIDGIDGVDGIQGSRLGPDYSNEQIEAALIHCRQPYTRHNQAELLTLTATALANGDIVGWFQGRAEFGPRALGGRSILASAASTEMRDKLNQAIKKRESFRPFAPCVLQEEAAQWFDLDDSPYMLLTCHTNSKAVSQRIPAAVHIDGSSRLQTVSRDQNPLFHQLISEYASISDVPVLLNTSFNIKDEPIVQSPEDAIRCMHNASLDLLVIGDFMVRNTKV